MSSPLKSLLILSILIFFNACGVKGKPQPPLEQPVIGRGEMTQVKKSKTDAAKKKSYKQVEPDWDEKDDFIEETQ